MESQTLTIESRIKTGKGACRKIRRTGKVPAVLYGLGNNATIQVEPKVITKTLLTEGGQNQIFVVKGAGLDDKKVLIKDWHVDPVTRNLMHVDLIEIDTTKKVRVTISLSYTGKAAGVADGGVLNTVTREIEVSCFPDRIPSHIDVDVSALAIGDAIHSTELTLPEGIELVDTTSTTLVTVVPPTKEEATADLTPAAEPEVITAKADAGATATSVPGAGKPEKK